MITRSKQSWAVGNAVKVGFLTLTIVAAVPTPGDFAPDAYVLRNATGTQLYRFVPHRGVEKITVPEAKAMLASAQALAASATAVALRKANAPTAMEQLFA